MAGDHLVVVTRTALLGFMLAAASVASLATALMFGSLPIGFTAVLDSIVFPAPGIIHDVIWNLRAPRAFAAFACGGLLALAGALLQVLLRNALADPYVLGVSSGASLGALLALSLGAGAAAMNLSAFGGAVAALVVVFGLTYRSGDWNVYRLLLTGVVLSAGLSALISLTLVLAPDAQVKGMLFWLMGDLSQTTSALPAWLILGALAALGVAASFQLDLLALGDLKARSLGVAVGPLQLGVFAAAAVATVTAVVLGGAIGFIGLMAPHAIRLAGATSHRILLPLSALLGGTVLTLADTAARTAWAPQQLPVGIFTALLGVPAMLLLLSRQR
ncbi:MAG: iron transporter permease [Betaproteobacteria bacterium]|jgi:iron complex transport system permease protein|nr:iron transporter permease [Betaproteobacteria bacterium]